MNASFAELWASTTLDHPRPLRLLSLTLQHHTTTIKAEPEPKPRIWKILFILSTLAILVNRHHDSSAPRPGTRSGSGRSGPRHDLGLSFWIRCFNSNRRRRRWSRRRRGGGAAATTRAFSDIFAAGSTNTNASGMKVLIWKSASSIASRRERECRVWVGWIVSAG